MAERVLVESGKRPKVRVRNARGGHGRVLDELELYQKTVKREPGTKPDILVVAIDCNCKRFGPMVSEIKKRIEDGLFPRVVPACPDPHIERWYMADPESFQGVVGRTPPGLKRKCERERYKKMLVKTLEQAGHPVTMGGIEFAPDLVSAMDLFRAGKHLADLRHFLDGLRDAAASLP